MPGIFHRLGGQWHLTPVVGSPSLLRLDPMSIESPALKPVARATNECLLVCVGGQNRWATLVADDAGLRHNGTPIAAGLRMLEHRDALAVDGGEGSFFTTEELAHVEAYAGSAAISCPRCRSHVSAGDAVVRCPSCGVVHHEMADRNCWTYAEACALCSQPTALDAGLRWTPEDL